MSFIDVAAFSRRVRAAAQLRAQLLPVKNEGGTTLDAYRVIHGEGDFLPGITVDRYGEFLVIHLYSAALEPHLPVLLDALADVYHPRGVYLQRRFRPLGGEGPREPAELVRGVAAPPEVEVREGELRFGIDVTSPLSTGLFLDLRLGRQAVAARSRGRDSTSRIVSSIFSRKAGGPATTRARVSARCSHAQAELF